MDLKETKRRAVATKVPESADPPTKKLIAQLRLDLRLVLRELDRANCIRDLHANRNVTLNDRLGQEKERADRLALALQQTREG